MRFLIVAVALAVFTGSQASSTKSQSDLRLEKWIEEWGSRMEKVIDKASEELGLLQKSEFYDEVEELLYALILNATEIWKEHPWPEDLTQTSHLFSVGPYDTVSKAANKLLRIGRYWELVESIRAAFDALALYVDPILEPITPQAKTLLDDLAAKAEGQLPTLQNTRRNLESLGDKLLPYLKEYGKPAVPAVLQAEQKFILVLEAFHKHVLDPYFAPVLKATERYASDFQRWISNEDPPSQSKEQ